MRKRLGLPGGHNPQGSTPPVTPDPGDGESGRRIVCLVVLALMVGLSGSDIDGQGIWFEDVTEAKGISFVHENGASGRKFTIETFCGGVGVFDYDGDGDLDIYFVNGAPLPGFESESVPKNRLYRNDGEASGWTFTDVTEEAGVEDVGYGFGCAVGDIDNDGDLDLYVTNFGANVLYVNNGDGTFTDVTETAGVGDTRLNTSAAFVDTDQDGDLDLFVCAYTNFDLSDGQVCTQKDGSVIYCGPENYLGAPDRLYRNNGDGTFSDISKDAGVYSEEGKGLGIITTDHDGDGDIDIFVANDLVENHLFENVGGGQFEEIALIAGMAYNETGRPEAGMGVDFADVDGDGLQDVLIGHFDFETSTLYKNEGGSLFSDVTPASGLGPPSWHYVTFGLLFLDAENDGYPDVAAVNGHVIDNIERVYPTRTYKQRNQVYRNLGDGTFDDATVDAGPGFIPEKASRGLAAGDLDRDGDIDLVVVNTLERADVLENKTGSANQWLSVRAVGGARGISPQGSPKVSNRDGIGARITVQAGGRTQVKDVHSSSSYLAANPREVHFGLGQVERIERVEVRWPSGVVDRLTDVNVNQVLVINEGQSGAGR